MPKAKYRADLFLSFVCDKDSEETLTSLSVAHLDLKSEVKQGGVAGAIKYLKTNTSPRILLVDISESEFPVSDVQSLAEVCAPNVLVIAIGQRNEVGVFRDLMGLGVRDYIVKPLSSSLIVRSLEQQLNESDDESLGSGFTVQGKLVAFVGAKGGVGVSTFAANSAWILGNEHSKRIGLVDLDLQFGTIAQIFDIPTSGGFSEALESADRIDDVFVDRVMVKQSQHLSVLSAEEVLGKTLKLSEKSINNLIPILTKQFHYTIFDVPRDCSEKINTQVLKQASVVTIVADFSIISVRDTVRILKLLKDNQTPDQRIIVAVNRAGEYKQGEIEQQVFEESIERKVDCIINFDPLTPLSAMNEGEPVVAEKGILSNGIHNVTELIMGRQLSTSNQKNKGLINHLFALNR